MGPGERLHGFSRKSQEVFSGSFGMVVAESAYYYPAGDYENPAISFGVRAVSNRIRREVPRVIKELPSSATQLDSVTVIRHFRSQAEELVAVGTYNPDGELLSVVVDAFKSGLVVPRRVSNETMTVDDQVNENIQMSGLPLKFSVPAYLQSSNTLARSASRPP